MRERRSKKFFTGKPRAHVVFLFGRGRTAVYCCQADVQCVVDVIDEFAYVLFMFLLFLGNPLHNFWQFAGISCLGGVGFEPYVYFFAAIAAKAQQQAALMAIMGFPIIIPQLLLLSKIALIAFSSVVQSGLLQMCGLLVAFDAMVVVLAIILFPFLWKD